MIKSLSAVACYFLFAIPIALGADGEGYRIMEDGGVVVQGNRFADMSSYHRSDQFRANGRRCGTRLLQEQEWDEKLAKSVTDCTKYRTDIQAEYWLDKKTYILPVWFHVIYASDGTGNISDADIQAQIQVLNEDFGALEGTMGAQGIDSHIQFELAGITRTLNNDWFYEDYYGMDELDFKRHLGKDQTQYVNVYTNIPSENNLGYSYYPQDQAGEVLDGIVLLYSAVGGRHNGNGDYNHGRTLVHEMGHYLGLLHTFEDGVSCQNSFIGGDLVVDTPAEWEAHYDCIQTYTCLSADPIHNYMNYTDDSCVTNFTGQQVNRAVCSIVNYRPGAYRVDGEVADIVIPPILKILLLEP